VLVHHGGDGHLQPLRHLRKTIQTLCLQLVLFTFPEVCWSIMIIIHCAHQHEGVAVRGAAFSVRQRLYQTLSLAVSARHSNLRPYSDKESSLHLPTLARSCRSDLTIRGRHSNFKSRGDQVAGGMQRGTVVY